MIRLGLCCKFLEAPIRFRTTTATFLKRCKNPLTHINEIIKNNVQSLENAITFCQEHKIKSFRIGSDFMPVATHPEVGYTLEDLPEGDVFHKKLKACGEIAKQTDIRLTFHPDQFVVLSSPHQEVVIKSLTDLEYHTQLGVILGADVINIHGGGGYGNKPAALTRFQENFKRLSSEAQKRLTLENDDKVYTPSDLLPICKELSIPFVYDVHHHRCLPDELTIEEATQAALTTWDREPLFHISSPLQGWEGPKPHRHHDYIDIKDLPNCWKEIDSLTLEVEAKAKEKAIFKLRQELVKESWRI